MANIITVGEILVEVMAKEVGQKFDAPGEFVGPFPSGAPAIFIDQAAKCGSSTLIVSAIGNDGFGKLNVDRLQSDGVDISRIKKVTDVSTGVAFVTYKEDGSRDFLYHIANAACGDIQEADVVETDFKDCNYYHIMGSSLYNENTYRAILRGLEYAKQNGCKISFDPNVRKEIVNDDIKRSRLVEILNAAHIVLAGEDELFYLMGIADEVEGVTMLLEQGAQIVVIKRGSRGATLYTNEKKVDVGAHPVEEIDPTGAGDCFGGTFISCLNQGIDAVDALQLSAIAGAFAVSKRGPMEGNTTLQQLKSLVG